MLLALALLIQTATAPLESQPAEQFPAQSAEQSADQRVGIAAAYPGDAGIENHPAVIKTEMFSRAGIDTLDQRWDSVRHPQLHSFSEDRPPGSGAEGSLLITHVGGETDGSHLYSRLLPGHDQVYARFYVKFDEDCAPIHHFGNQLGGYNPPTPWPQGGAGTLPTGLDRFKTAVEPYGSDWSWDFYSYWSGMRQHGDGRYWGTPFLTDGSRPPVAKNRWICVELMMKVNDPVEESNGEQAFWIDGELFSRDGQVVSRAGPGFPKGAWTGGWWRPDASADTAFEGFQFRKVEDLAINFVNAYVYITRAPEGHISRIWFANIVVATEYIGPIAE